MDQTKYEQISDAVKSVNDCYSAEACLKVIDLFYSTVVTINGIYEEEALAYLLGRVKDLKEFKNSARNELADGFYAMVKERLNKTIALRRDKEREELAKQKDSAAYNELASVGNEITTQKEESPPWA